MSKFSQDRLQAIIKKLGLSDEFVERVRVTEEVVAALSKVIESKLSLTSQIEIIAATAAAHIGRLAVEADDDHDTTCTAGECMAAVATFVNHLGTSVDFYLKQDAKDDAEKTKLPFKLVAADAYPDYDTADLFSALVNVPKFSEEVAYLAPAANNAMGISRCPTCLSEGHELQNIAGKTAKFMAFRDIVSVDKFHKTALCQECQDKESKHG